MEESKYTRIFGPSFDQMSFNKAYEMIRSGCITSLGYNWVEDCQDFRIIASNENTSVRYYKNKQENVFVCTCNQNSDSKPCEHVVMVGLSLMADKGVDFIKATNILKNTNLLLQTKKTSSENTTTTNCINHTSPRGVRPYYISEFDPVTNEQVKANSPSNYVYESSLKQKFKIEKFLFNEKENSIIFSLSNLEDYNNIDSIAIQFKVINNHLEIRSDNFTKSQKLQSPEIYLLHSIANSPSPNLFQILTQHKTWLREIKENVNRYNIESEEQFYDFFELTFTPTEGLKSKFKNKVLIPVDQEYSVEHFDKLLEESAKETENRAFLSSTRTLKKTKEYALAFCVVASNRQETTEGEIVPMIGELNKQRDNFSRKLTVYQNSRDQLSLTTMGKDDQELLSLLHRYTEGREYNKTKEFDESSLRILELLKKQPFVYYLSEGNQYNYIKKDLAELSVSDNPIVFRFTVDKNKQYIQLAGNFSIKNQNIDLNEITKIDTNFCINQRELCCFERAASNELVSWAGKPLLIPEEGYDQLLKKYILPLSQYYPIQFKDDVYKIKNIELDIEKKSIFLSEENESVLIRPSVTYDGQKPILLQRKGTLLLSNGERNVTAYVRNEELEEEFNEFIASLHPSFQNQKGFKSYYISYDEFTTDMWFSHFFDKLQALDIETFGLKKLKKFKYTHHKARVSTSIKTNIDWFDISVDVAFGKEEIRLNTIRKAVLNKEKYIQLKDGSVGILPDEWMHKLEKYFRHATINKEKLQLSKTRFSIIDELFDEIDDTKTLEEIADKKSRLRLFTNIEDTEVPKQVKATLRHYQKQGVNWMNFLDDMQWGGILADDMGLGKTLQVLTFLQQVILKNSTTNLVIVPTSLLFNWQSEIQKFVPNLKVLFHYGVNRKQGTDHFNNYELVFVTYGIMLRDIELLKEYQFNYLILDESQAIKNPSSRRYKAACLLKANNRIAMSGTPIENNTFDLFAQMSFVNRGIFGGAVNFKNNFSNPIDNGGDTHIGSELQRLINPFVLRRTKEMVASELPPKVEDVIFCEMGKEQRKLYNSVRDELRNQLLTKIDNIDINNSKLLVLEALTRLRQICDSPQLLNNNDSTTTESVKLKEIVNQITEKTGKHKILVFSQFTQMLSLVKMELAKREIEYEYLDGKSSSLKREKSVEQFQNNPDLRVFLISLKAGGTGLNLTAADYVYLLDPWWNPAAEAQAIDRCYRIGQDKSVFAYRMICKDTIEEKIIGLQNKKRAIATDIISNDEDIMKTLNNAEIQNLFS